MRETEPTNFIFGPLKYGLYGNNFNYDKAVKIEMQ
jgi:hypothetical protein